MATQMPKLVIPTGYESQQRDIERRRKIAEALIEKGLGPQGQMTSPWQALAQAVNAWAGKRMQKKTDGREDELAGEIRQEYDDKRISFANDGAMFKPAEMVAKYGGDPLMAEDLKPYREALQRALTEREQLQNVGGKIGVRTGDVMGTFDPGKVTDLVRQDAQGNPYTNTIAVDAQARANAAGQGYAPEPAPQGPQQSAGIEGFTFEQFKGLQNGLTPRGAAEYLQRQGKPVYVNSPQEVEALPQGAKFVGPDGVERIKQ